MRKIPRAGAALLAAALALTSAPPGNVLAEEDVQVIEGSDNSGDSDSSLSSGEESYVQVLDSTDSTYSQEVEPVVTYEETSPPEVIIEQAPEDVYTDTSSSSSSYEDTSQYTASDTQSNEQVITSGEDDSFTSVSAEGGDATIIRSDDENSGSSSNTILTPRDEYSRTDVYYEGREETQVEYDEYTSAEEYMIASSYEEETEEVRETESETEDIPEIKERETEEEDDDEDQSGFADSGISTTGYFWDESWYIADDFRFRQVEKRYALAEGDGGMTFVYGARTKRGQLVGILPYFSLAYILDGDLEEDEWVYIESGEVRGFVKSSDLASDAYTGALVGAMGEDVFVTGTALVSYADNAAYTFTKTTTKAVVAQKINGLVIGDGSIYEEKSTTSRETGTVKSGCLVYILVASRDGWYYVESGDVRGFLPKSVVLTGDSADSIVSAIGENNLGTATAVLSAEENKSTYYTLLSTQAAKTPAETLGEMIAADACTYVGRLGYVWGGTSLVYGADCSGFTQSMFAKYGVKIPRLAQDQGRSGEVVSSLRDARPGDIVYYADGPHVGIYIGNGLVVQCSGGSRNTQSNPGRGPTISNATYRPITSIRRYLLTATDYISVGGYRTDNTQYTQSQMELIWAIVAQEDNGSYAGALAVISTAMNRTESASWGGLGGNALSQLTASGQFCYSLDTYWIKRLGGNVPDYVKKAVEDCLHFGVRNHTHTSFRSRSGKVTGSSAVQIGGNWYFG